MIHILPPNLRDQIAAGEVVERPASIVKEVLENALDAGATQIEIQIQNGGKDLIEIQDNGSGMNETDADLSVERYATSKISKIEDLYNIHSFGFRGEALASIASVSDFLLQTKQSADLSGTKVQVKGGKKYKTIQIGCKNGTKVIVKDLFFNLPARLKFLKSDTTESGYILKTIQDFAIMHPQVSWRYQNNQKTILDLMPEENSVAGRKKRLEKLFRKEIIQTLVPIDLNLGYLSLTGFTVLPNHPQGSRNYQFTFVNGRNVEDKTIKSAVNEAYANLIPRGTYPVYFLFVEISPDLVDVNVHPRKTEVRFLKQQEVFLAVKKSLQDALAKNSETSGGVSFTHSFQNNPYSLSRKTEQWSGSSNFSSGKSNYYASGNSSRPNQKEISLALDFSKNILQSSEIDSSVLWRNDKNEYGTENFPWRIIGQVSQSYILVERDNQLYFIDQHAADERLKYEKVKSAYQSKAHFKQNLLIPVKIEVSTLQKEMLENNLENLAKIGFEVEYLGGKTFLLNSVPQDLAELDLEKIFIDLLDEFSDELKQKTDFMTLMERTFKYIACRSAVMFGDKMNFQEMQELVKNIFANTEHKTCPHGRPFIWQIPFEEINKKFNR